MALNFIRPTGKLVLRDLALMPRINMLRTCFNQLACRAKQVLNFGLAMLVGALLLATAATAQTTIAGAIATDSRWTVASSPYLVSGDIVVQNGAILTIDAGVTVYMAGNSGLTVQAGGIKALGSASNPIQVLSEKTRIGQAAAPGDWKQWTFNAGAINTKLDYVNFDHGSGLVVNGSAPIFNFLNLRFHSGSAITVDLAASPSGVGIQASGNTINGIAVPAGDINNSVTWGLRGISYVIAAGTVSVGASPKVTSITPDVIQQGETLTLNVTGTRLTGLSKASFDNTDLKVEILPGATDTQASLSVVAETSAVIGSTTARFLVHAGEAKLVNALKVIQAQPTVTSMNPSTVYAGQGAVDIVVNGYNFTNQSVVQVNGAAVATQFVSATQLRIQVTAASTPDSMLVRLRSPDPLTAGQFIFSNERVLPAIAAQLTVTPDVATATKGVSQALAVKLPYPAPAGGISVNLTSSVTAAVTVPAAVNIAAGQTVATFLLAANDLGSSTITASRVGYVSGQSQVIVIASPTLTITPAVIRMGVGRTTDITIQTSKPAGVPGLLVNLISSDTQIARVPVSVLIPAGATTISATVTSIALGRSLLVAQAADYVEGRAEVVVDPASIYLPDGSLVSPGLTRLIPLNLSDPAPLGGLVVTLESSNTAAATVSPSITVPAGQSSANFTLTGIAAGLTSVNAAAAGYRPTTMSVKVGAVTLSLGQPVISSLSVVEAATKSFAVNLSNIAPAGGVVVNLSMGDSNKATVTPASITIAPGETSGGLVQATVRGISKGETTLTASAAGLTSVNLPITVTGKPVLSFNAAATVVGKRFKSYESSNYVSITSDGNVMTSDKPVSITLTSTDSAKASVPVTVTIPAGQSYGYFSIIGVSLTGASPVTIDATATGYASPVTKLAVSVVNPEIGIAGLDTTRSTTSQRDDFYMNVSIPGGDYLSMYSELAADLPVNLSVVEATPVGIVPALYDDATAGNATTQAVLKAGTRLDSLYYYSPKVYVGTPTTAGSYKIKAEITGGNNTVSEVQTVAAPQLSFNVSSLTVGKGFASYSYGGYVQRGANGVAIAGADALTVNLTSSDAAKASVPVTVTIPAGQSYGYFSIIGVSLTGASPVTIDATATGYASPVTKLAVSVVNPEIGIAGLDTTRSTTSQRDDFYMNVSIPGGDYLSMYSELAADLPVNLSVVEATPVGIVPALYDDATAGNATTQAVLKAGTRLDSLYYYSPKVYVGTPTTAGSYKIKAEITGGNNTVSEVQTVAAPQLSFLQPKSLCRNANHSRKLQNQS